MTTENVASKIQEECQRQEESCLYTSTSMFEWLKFVRIVKTIFIAMPIVISAIAGVSIVQEYLPTGVIVILALLAGLFPALESALKIQTNVDEVARSAAEFKSLQDRFRILRTVDVVVDHKNARSELETLMNKMDEARKLSLTAPSWAFKKARKKIEAGHYKFEIDSKPELR